MNFIVLSLNIVMFIVYFRFNSSVSVTVGENKLYEALSLQISILDTIVVITTIGLSILGFVGYNNIKDAAVKAAKNEADQYLKANMATPERDMQQSSTPSAGMAEAITPDDKIVEFDND